MIFDLFANGESGTLYSQLGDLEINEERPNAS